MDKVFFCIRSFVQKYTLVGAMMYSVGRTNICGSMMPVRWMIPMGDAGSSGRLKISMVELANSGLVLALRFILLGCCSSYVVHPWLSIGRGMKVPINVLAII